MNDIRCKKCNRVLAKCTIIVGAIKCPRCKMIFEYKEYGELFQASTYTNHVKIDVANTGDSDNIK